jgi:hypothetical protein
MTGEHKTDMLAIADSWPQLAEDMAKDLHFAQAGIRGGQ